MDMMSGYVTVGAFFFFNDTATTEIYTLSLHDALPIYDAPHRRETDAGALEFGRGVQALEHPRSEEHTSELQSQSNLVCRLLLEKKKTHEPLTVPQPRLHTSPRPRITGPRAIAVDGSCV